MILRKRRLQARGAGTEHAGGRAGIRRPGARQRCALRASTTSAIRSSRSSCWPPTRRWRSTSPASACRSCAASIPPRSRQARSLRGVRPQPRLQDGAPRRSLRPAAHPANTPPASRTQHAIHYALLRSLKQAVYSPVEEGHYALASENYCHFTSPIRRYPDLTVHRLLGRWLRTGKAGSDETELAALGDHCSKMERRAENAERELIKLKLLTYLSERIGLELEVDHHRRRRLRLLRPGGKLPGRGPGPRQHADRTITTTSRKRRTA